MGISTKMTRREALRTSALGAAGLAAGAMPLAGATVPARPDTRSPNEALERLLAGNQRFLSGETADARRTLDRVRDLADGQAPYAAILGCADSRVPPEILFDEGFGDLFTVRVAGNVATPEEIASLEYAAGVLGSSLLMVLGHTSCGAVTAAVDGGDVPGQISSLFQHIAPNVPAGSPIDVAVEANVRHQVAVLQQASTVIRGGVRAGTHAVVGAVYELDSGRVRLLD
jgi:carbonic anhydrase